MLKYTLIFIFNDNEVMLLKRKYDPIKNQLTGIGGHIEENENPLQCVIRETFEETGIKANENEIKYLGKVPSISSYVFKMNIKEKPFNTLLMNEGKIEWYNKQEVINNPELSKEARLLLLYYV